jgi:hypothetical protein
MQGGPLRAFAPNGFICGTGNNQPTVMSMLVEKLPAKQTHDATTGSGTALDEWQRNPRLAA